MNEWKVSTLGDCADWYSGGTPKTSVSEYWNGDIPWITASSLHNFYIRDSERRVTPLGLENGTRLVPKDTILFVVRGMSLKTEFRVGITCCSVTFGQDCKALIPKAGISPLFLANILRGRAEEILGLVDEASHGTGRLATDVLKDFKIWVPPLDEQTEIAAVLSCLDRKIENLRKQNETLEAIAQALFKHWFVDFEFPNEDGKPYKSSGGEMVRSELGKIPTDWNITKLGNFCDIKHGYAFKGEFITTEETDQILLTPGNFKVGGGFNPSKYKYYSDSNYDEEYILAPGDLIVTMTDLSKEGDTLGYPAFVPKYSKNIFLHNQRLGRIVDSQIDLFFLFFLLCRREYRSHILGSASGSTVRHTSPSRILEYEFAVPTRKLLDQFSLIASNLICKSFSNQAQIETLAKTRDVLLPQLMSGKLRITDA